jgi:hypothetical protein
LGSAEGNRISLQEQPATEKDDSALHQGEKNPARATIIQSRLVEAREQHRWNVEPQRLRGLEIDHKLELGRLLNRQVGGLLPLEGAINITGRLPALVGGVTPYDIKPPLVSRTACGTL